MTPPAGVDSNTPSSTTQWKCKMRIERGAEAVDERHRPDPRCRTCARTVRPQALIHRAQEQAQRRALQVGVAVQEVT